MPEPLTARHLDWLVDLHFRSFPHDFINLCGPDLVRCLYAQALEHPGAAGFFCGGESRPLGFAIGLPRCQDFYAVFRRRNLGRIMLGLGRAALAKPARLARIWQAMRFEPGPDYGREGMELIYIAVEDDARGKGVGRGLVRALIQRGIEQGDRWLWTKSHSDNDGGNRLYLSCGFNEVRRVWLGPVEQIIYRREMV